MSRLGALHMTRHTGARHTATVIFFHGSGGTGETLKEWVRLLVKNFSFPHIKVLYPTAPLQPYTPAGGAMSNVWFDRAEVSKRVPEALDSIANIEVLIRDLIRAENKAGIPNNRIIVGGFSMGGALALYTAYRWEKDVAGVFAFSSFLNDNSIVYKEIKNTSSEKLPPLLQVHGDVDETTSHQFGYETFKELEAVGVKGEFCKLEKLGHSLNRRGLLIIKEWIEKRLPERRSSFLHLHSN